MNIVHKFVVPRLRKPRSLGQRFSRCCMLTTNLGQPARMHSGGSCSLPRLRIEHQSVPDRIAVHITQLLHPLLLRPHDKIVESPLPDVPGFDSLVPQTELGSGITCAPVPALEEKDRDSACSPAADGAGNSWW